MTQQGARKTSRKPAQNTSAEFSLNDWLAKRGLAGTRRMEIGGRWFEFVTTATPAQLAVFNEAYGKGDLEEMLSVLLVNPDDRDAIPEALEAQKQPLGAKKTNELLTTIVNFLVDGDVGESSAS